MSYLSILISILRIRESKLNDLETNEDTDTNYDLTEADHLHVVEREINCNKITKSVNPNLNYYFNSYKLIRLRVA